MTSTRQYTAENIATLLQTSLDRIKVRSEYQFHQKPHNESKLPEAYNIIINTLKKAGSDKKAALEKIKKDLQTLQAKPQLLSSQHLIEKSNKLCRLLVESLENINNTTECYNKICEALKTCGIQPLKRVKPTTNPQQKRPLKSEAKNSSTTNSASSVVIMHELITTTAKHEQTEQTIMTPSSIQSLPLLSKESEAQKAAVPTQDTALPNFTSSQNNAAATTSVSENSPLQENISENENKPTSSLYFPGTVLAVCIGIGIAAIATAGLAGIIAGAVAIFAGLIYFGYEYYVSSKISTQNTDYAATTSLYSQPPLIGFEWMSGLGYYPSPISSDTFTSSPYKNEEDTLSLATHKPNR